MRIEPAEITAQDLILALEQQLAGQAVEIARLRAHIIRLERCVGAVPMYTEEYAEKNLGLRRSEDVASS